MSSAHRLCIGTFQQSFKKSNPSIDKGGMERTRTVYRQTDGRVIRQMEGRMDGHRDGIIRLVFRRAYNKHSFKSYIAGTHHSRFTE